jgi:hypothetical protein
MQFRCMLLMAEFMHGLMRDDRIELAEDRRSIRRL